MPAVEKRTISLPSDQAAFIDTKVKAGDYMPLPVKWSARDCAPSRNATRQWNAGCAMRSPPAMMR